jgi:hypothetical protein
MTTQSPIAHSADQGPDVPFRDRGTGDRPWTPEEAEQGISHRIGDESPDPDTAPASVERAGKNVLAMPEEEDDVADDDDFDEDEEDEEDEDDEDDPDAEDDELKTSPA